MTIEDESLRYDRRFFRPWIIGAVIWGGLSLTILVAYIEEGDFRYLNELWFLLSLLWMQFGFAATFHAIRRKRRRNLTNLLLVMFLPPLILRFIIFILVAWHLERVILG